MNWKQDAATIRWNVQPFVGGTSKASASSVLFDHINPATEEVLYRAPVGSTTDVDDAVRLARQRFDDGCWSELPPVKRAEVLLRLADLIVKHKEEIALLESLEMGKPVKAALYDAEIFAPGLLRQWAGFANKLLGSVAPLNSTTINFNTYEPRGVVGAITPWNFPVVCAVFKIGPALAAGNTMVLKPSELAPSSALKLAELALEAGVPEGVLNVVPGLGNTVGVALARHTDVNMLTFTGSTVTGRKIMELAAQSNGKPLLLECGGKSPQIVFSDVGDLDAVADALVQNALWNQGQVCTAQTRLIVQEGVKDVLLERLVERVSKCHPADPLEEATTFGPLASPSQRDRVKAYVKSGVDEGAKAVLMGSIQEVGGCYVTPTIFTDVSADMRIVQEEIFGPVMCIQPFGTEEEAVKLANDTEYGLVASVWTRDMGRGKRLAHAIRAGGVYVRTSGGEGPDAGCMLSFEPQKASGFGAEMGLKGLESYSTLKWISLSGG